MSPSPSPQATADNNPRAARNFFTDTRLARLLQWIELYPDRSRLVIMTKDDLKNMPHKTTKQSCYVHAAQKVFNFADESDDVLKKLHENPESLETHVRNQIKSWKKQYDRVNQTIIKALQRGQKLEDVQIGTQLYEELARYHSQFPPWGRLHAHWHTVPIATSTVTTSRRNNDFDSDSDIENTNIVPGDPKIGNKLSLGSSSRRPRGILKRKRNRSSSISTAEEERGERGPTESSSRQNENPNLVEKRIKLETIKNETLKIKMQTSKELIMHFMQAFGEVDSMMENLN